MPRVAVVIPSYNHAEYIGEAMASVWGQTLLDLQLVVVDDGSADDSRGVIEAHADPRLVTCFQDNAGAHAAINRGIELAHPGARYISILNSDDIFAPQWLERAVAALEADPGVGFVASRLGFLGDKDGDKRRWYEPALDYYLECDDVERALLHRNFIMTTSNVVVRRELLERTGMLRPLRYVHDLDLFLRLTAISRFQLIDGKNVLYRAHGSNTIHQGEQSARIVYEFAWVLVDRLWRDYTLEQSPEALFRRMTELVRVLDIPDVASAALALFSLRATLDRRRASDAEIEAFWLSLLAEDHPILDWIKRSPRDFFSPRVQSMKMRIGKLEYDLSVIDAKHAEDTADLHAHIARLQNSGRYKLGTAIDEARDLRGIVQLPVKVLRAVRGGGNAKTAQPESSS
ncbi:MAG TPA: glycosyltransferase family A protein [Planctomycetota bacterium]|nr:glycosyltransferase family A protein [Planctomycetota bacterium]